MLSTFFTGCSHAYARLKRGGRVLCLLAVMGALTVSTVQAEKAWYPVEVDVWDPPFNDQRQREQKLYTPLERAQKKWRIRVFIPHLKDDYWLGVNYGLIDEARRLGIGLSIFEAGGYDQLEVQRRQIEESLKGKPDGLIIGAISLDGLSDLVVGDVMAAFLNVDHLLDGKHLDARFGRRLPQQMQRRTSSRRTLPPSPRTTAKI